MSASPLDTLSTTITLRYFDLFARGPPIALALAHGGLDWVGVTCGGGSSSFDGWAELKSTLPWRCLPVVDIPGVGCVGQEIAILNVLGSMVPSLRGNTPAELAVSQQLICAAEDIYLKIMKYTGTRYSTTPCTAEELESFWTDSNPTAHNKRFGLRDHLGLLEQFAETMPPDVAGFTSSGCTVGECKMFHVLELVTRITGNAKTVAKYPRLLKFYTSFGELRPTKEVLEGGGQFPKALADYFKTLDVCRSEIKAEQVEA